MTTGMSHMSRSIRRDALLFLSLIVQTYPEMCWPFADSVLPNCLTYLADRIAVTAAPATTATASGAGGNAGGSGSGGGGGSKGSKSGGGGAMGGSGGGGGGAKAMNMNAIFKSRAAVLDVVERFVALYPFDEAASAGSGAGAGAGTMLAKLKAAPTGPVWMFGSGVPVFVPRAANTTAYVPHSLHSGDHLQSDLISVVESVCF